MESVNQTKIKEKPAIITKKEIPPKSETFSSFSRTTSPTNDQFQYQNQNLTEKNKKEKEPFDSNNQNTYTSPAQKNKIIINEKNDSNGYINNIPSLSLEKNLNENNQMKRTKKQLFSQFSSFLNPKKQDFRNSMILNNNKYSKFNSKNILPIYRNRSTTNIYRDDKLRESTFRYVNTGKYSPLFSNSEENEEMNYNSRFSEELSLQKFNSNISIHNNKNTKNYENNDYLSKFNNKNKNNNNIICGDPSLYSSDDNIENSLKYEEEKKNTNLSRKNNKNKNKNENKKNDSFYDDNYNYNEIDNIFEVIREEMEKLIKMKLDILVNKVGSYLSNKKKNCHESFSILFY